MTGFDALLLDGEKIVWAGRPGQGLLLSGRDVLFIAFGLLFGAYPVYAALAWILRGHTSFCGAAAYVIFALVILYLIAGRSLLDAWIRRGVFYAITNRRILFARSWPFRALIVVHLNQLPAVRLTETTGGRGTIRFGEVKSAAEANTIEFSPPALDPTPQFLAIENAAAVFDLIQRSVPAH